MSASNAVMRAVGRDSRLDFRCRRRPIAGRQMFFLAIEHQLDRSIGRLGQFGAHQALGADAQRLAAETAAHVLAENAHIRLRNAQRAGEILARAVDSLGGNPCRQLVALPFAYRAMRFHAGVRDDLGRIGLLDRFRRRREARRQIARLRGRAARTFPPVNTSRRRAGQRLFDDRLRAAGPRIDFDRPRRIDRVFLRIGRYGRHLIALEHHAIVLRVGGIAPDERGFDARASWSPRTNPPKRRARVDRASAPCGRTASRGG